MNISNMGKLNGHSTGIILKELVRRAITTIEGERLFFEVSSKLGYGGKMDDVFTSADKKAQEVYLKSIAECFPNFGIVAEENSIRNAKPGKPYITVDPLDGTRAFVRRQSHGVGTMIAMVDKRKVVSAFVGDVNTNEIFGYRPGSCTVHRVHGYSVSEKLVYKKQPLARQYIALRDPIGRYTDKDLVTRTCQRFKNYTVDGGSIGVWFARLWNGECGALLIPAGVQTPWDLSPIVGITLKMGFVFLKPVWERSHRCRWEIFSPKLSIHNYVQERAVLVIHRTNMSELYRDGRGAVSK